MFFQEGNGNGFPGRTRVHVSQFGPGFTFTTFGNGMNGMHMRQCMGPRHA